LEQKQDRGKIKLSIRGSEDPERSFISSFLYWLNYQWKQIMLWLAPVEGENWMIGSLKYLGKIIALILAIILSPVLLFILITLVFLAL
jgi:hypothetical protein